MAAVMPAGVSFLANMLGARMFGLKLFGLWVVWRSVIRLTSSITPGFNAALTVLLPRYQRGESYQLVELTHWAADKLALIWGALAALVVIPATYLFLDRPSILKWGIICLWFGTFYSGYSECIARGRRNGHLILAGGMVDTFGALMCVISTLTGGITLFIWLQAFRQWSRAAVQFQFPASVKEVQTTHRFWVQIKKLIKVGIPLIVRGWVQTAAQYGDRLVIGGVFGATIVGAAGLGSMLALPTVMLASTAAAWLLPILIARQGEGGEEEFIYEMITIATCIVGGIFIIPLYPYVVPESAPDIEILVLAYLVVCQLSLLVPILTPVIAADRIWFAALLHAIGVAAIVLTIVVFGSVIRSSPEFTLSAAVITGSLTITGIVLVIPSQRLNFSPVRLLAPVIIGTLVLTGYSRIAEFISEVPLFAIGVGTCGAALFGLAGWRILSRPSVDAVDVHEVDDEDV